MSEGAVAIVGAGPGNGAACGRRFAEAGQPVALCARSLERLQEMAGKIPGARAYAYDVREPEAPGRVFASIRRDLGPVATLVYNAGSGSFGHFDDVSAEDLEAAWEVNARGLFLAAREVVPGMREAGGGDIVVIGATASLRGGANFLAFAAAKAAQRSLAQSLARHLGPQGIHVSYVIVDGVIDLEHSRQMMPDRPDEGFMSPSDIADAVHFLTTQARSAWTFELDLRPFGEKW